MVYHPPEEYEFVSWDDDIPNIRKNKKGSKPPNSFENHSSLKNGLMIKRVPVFISRSRPNLQHSSDQMDWSGGIFGGVARAKAEQHQGLILNNMKKNIETNPVATWAKQIQPVLSLPKPSKCPPKKWEKYKHYGVKCPFSGSKRRVYLSLRPSSPTPIRNAWPGEKYGPQKLMVTLWKTDMAICGFLRS